jgi:hypothetical protein
MWRALKRKCYDGRPVGPWVPFTEYMVKDAVRKAIDDERQRDPQSQYWLRSAKWERENLPAVEREARVGLPVGRVLRKPPQAHSAPVECGNEIGGYVDPMEKLRNELSRLGAQS